MKSLKPVWVVVLCVAVAAIFMLSPYGQKALMADDTKADSAQTSVVAMAETETEAEVEAETTTTSDGIVETTAPKEISAEATITTSANADTTSEAHVLMPRTLGNPDAPVKIEEFASLSCPHCADFHTHVFPKLKSEYIDTGKVYFTFTDFPLNAPALEGALIARCLPEARYFKFLSFLFEKQADWAFDGMHTQYLKQNARLLGLGEEDANECLSNEKLRMGMVSKMQEAQKQHQVNSTPSFVINNSKVVSGGQSFEAFKEEIDALLK